MEINKKSRTELKMYFVKNAIPTEGNFRDLIEGMLNHKDDGVTKSAGAPLSIEAATADERPAIHLYESFAAAPAPSWVLSLLPGATSGGKTTGKGLGIGDGAGAAKARLFLEAQTGNLGIGVVDPAGYKLNVAGSVNASGAMTAGGGLTVLPGQTLTANGPLSATAGATVSGGVLSANAGATVAGGVLSANGGATVSGGVLSANAGLTVAGGVLTANGGATVSGSVLTANAGLTVASGVLTANGGATVSGSVLTANAGLTVASGVLTANGGATVSGSVLTANAGLTIASGVLTANGGATVSGGALNANAILNANAGLTVGTSASNQPATVNGPLTVSGLVTTGDLTVGTAAANKTLTVNGGLGTNQLTIGTGGVVVNGELALNGSAGLYDSTIYLRNKADHNHGIGYYGANKLFQGRGFDGPVLFGYGGGGLGSVATQAVGVEGALVLDGTNSYVQLPALTFDFSKGLTIEAWVYYNSFNTWSRIIDFGNGASSDNLLLANSAGTSDLALSSYVGTGGPQVLAPGVLKTGVWMHLCATIDTAGTAVLYVNGTNVKTGPSQLPKSNIARSNCYIGKSNWDDQYFNGRIANVRIWQRPLSAQEVSESMNLARSVVAAQSPAAWVTGLAAFWPLNDATGSSARDLSGRGQHGTLQGKATFESYQKLALTWDGQSNVTIPNSGTLTARMHPVVQTFQVGGAWEKFYPILFADDGWNEGCLELHITRALIHQDSSWRGSTLCYIRCHSSYWGNASSFCRFVEHYFHTAQFVGGAQNVWRAPLIIVWLRGGGTTYQWRSNHPARLVDATAMDSRLVGVPPDSETFVAKTTPDANLSATDSV